MNVVIGVWLLVVWTMLWGRVRTDVLLSGVLVAAAVLVASALPAVPLRSRVHWRRAPGLATRFAVDLFGSSREVLAATLRTGRRTRSSVLEIRLPAAVTDAAVVLVCNRISLEPGTIVVDIDRTHDRIFVYQLDTPDEAAVEGARERTRRVVEDVTRTVTRREAAPVREEGDR